MAPGTAVLGVQHPVRLGDGLGVEHAVRTSLFQQVRHKLQQAVSGYTAVDDHMSNVNVLWPEFPRQALCEGAQAGLGRRERREVGLAPQTAGGAGKDQGAATVSRLIELRTMMVAGDGRSQLIELQSADAQYPLVGTVDLELQVEMGTSVRGGAGISVWVVSAKGSGERTSATTHTVRVHLTPTTASGEDVPVADRRPAGGTVD